ncbi:hypothetical protein B9Z39_05095 [Limnohabitans sp. JirII-29]|uniref:DUF5666 domain-containing protein n=1 Tax=Limnohabitans sp. JirII-29 TaxID=1835756 RepID=UPI000D3D5E73|nr:DUF5666 domain-containing protein [Limnohabitans sp. JirII-29]PUE29443.1 hypothetical protein B9Z39_05095 [Limnohabitans sp. JirII-29]
MPSIQTNPTFTRRTLLLGMIGSVAHLTGCGGGGSDVAGLSSGGTGSFTSGTISGLGSIIVNGIRYNDDNATVISRDDGTSFGQPLKVGMVVSIQGSAVTAATTTNGTATATATKISCGSEWQGPVSSVSASSFNMLGLTVDVLTSTVFEGVATQLAGLSTSHFVEVHGYVDQTTGHLQATHVEVSNTQPTQYKLSGVVNNFSAVNRTFKLGTTAQPSSQISWDSNTSVPSSWSDGVFVRVTMTPGLLGTHIRLLTSPLALLDADNEQDVEIHGFISAYQSNANFTVNGIQVDASNARIAGGSLALGVRVEIKGSLNNSILVATKVETPSNSEEASRTFEFHGTLSALDATAQTFVLHGLTFQYNNSTSMQGITLANGVSIEVKATRSSGAWVATEISSDA